MKGPNSEGETAAAAGAANASLAGSRGEPPAAYNLSITASELALAQLRRLLAAWQLHEPGARLGHDAEALHQLRVTVRRIDATLSLFKRQLPVALTQARRTGKAVLRVLGAARDLDVQLGELARYCAALPEHERPHAEPLQARLEAERTRTRARMVRTLDSESTRQWLQTLASASAQPPAANGAFGERAALVMPERVQRRYRKLRKSVRRLGGKSSMEDYHLVRRRAKQLRYAIESGAALFGKPAQDMLKSLRRLQDNLGAQQDAYMAGRRLAALAAEPANELPPATLFLMGRLAEQHGATPAGARRTLNRSWRKVRGRRWRTLRGRLSELGDGARAALPPLALGTAAVQAGSVAPEPQSQAPEPSAETHALKH
jgi:CHAD domain-containing protein